MNSSPKVVFLSQAFFILVYFINIITNIKGYQDFLVEDIKHYSMIIFAISSFLTNPYYSILSVLFLLPIALIYFIGYQFFYVFMTICFAMSLPLIWIFISSVVKEKNYALVSLVVLISLLPTIINFPDIYSNGLIDMTYGRERVLLGYFHPKEAAISFFIPIFLILLLLGNNVKFLWWGLAALFLWLIGSRNVSLVILIGYFLRKNFLVASVVIFLFFTLVFLASLYDNSLINLIDAAISFRISSWQEALNTNIPEGRVRLDNFFVEAFLIAGWPAITLIGIFFFSIYILYYLKSNKSSWAPIAFVMLLFASSFDSGIVSTGNMLHLVLMSIVLSPIFAKSNIYGKLV